MGKTMGKHRKNKGKVGQPWENITWEKNIGRP